MLDARFGFARNGIAGGTAPTASGADGLGNRKSITPNRKSPHRPNSGNDGSRCRGGERPAATVRNFAADFYLPGKPQVDPGRGRLARALQKAEQQHNQP
jgi:hypothetical protein